MLQNRMYFALAQVVVTKILQPFVELLAGYTSGHSLLISPTRSIVIF